MKGAQRFGLSYLDIITNLLFKGEDCTIKQQLYVILFYCLQHKDMRVNGYVGT